VTRARAAVRVVVAALSLAAMATACNALLGNDDKVLGGLDAMGRAPGSDAGADVTPQGDRSDGANSQSGEAGEAGADGSSLSDANTGDDAASSEDGESDGSTSDDGSQGDASELGVDL
jgi:hypothetical protein